MSQLGCIYLQIQDAILFRTCTDPISGKPYKTLAVDDSCILNPLQGLDISDTVVFEITQGHNCVLKLSAKPFNANNARMANIPESASSFYSHPYALADLAVATEEIKRFVTRSRFSYIRSILCQSDPITWNVFQAACFYVQQNLICKNTIVTRFGLLTSLDWVRIFV
jgi:hypothetical protein